MKVSRYLAWAVLAVLLVGQVGGAASDQLTVHFINVGQGDAILVDWGLYEILLDGGPSDAWVSYLSDYIDGPLELLIVTHPHEDHIGGLPSVLATFSVDQVWVSGATHTTQMYQVFAGALSSSGAQVITVACGHALTVGELTLQVLYPCRLTGDVNNDSIVVRLAYGEVTFLFTGDIEERGERDLREVLSRTDVLKVAHHGSGSSSTAEFLAVIRPKVAVYSSSRDNHYGHPAPSVLQRLCAVGASIYGTDNHGTVQVSTDGKDTWLASTTDEPAFNCDPPLPDCQACVERLNRATLSDFKKVHGIGDTLAKRLIAAQPFTVLVCRDHKDIESVLERIYMIGPERAKAVVQCFCPELYHR